MTAESQGRQHGDWAEVRETTVGLGGGNGNRVKKGVKSQATAGQFYV